MKSEKELKKIYNKYINKPIYRVIPKRTLKNILKNGINPKKSPYEKIKPKVIKLSNIIKKLTRKQINISYMRGKEVTANFIIKEINNDLSKTYIDFCSSKQQTKYYLKYIPGGGIPSAIRGLTKELIKRELLLNKKELQLIKELNKWAKSKKDKNTVISVDGKSFVFEKAIFQLTGTHKAKKRKEFKKSPYLPSPFGSFKHFKKVIKKQGLRKYTSRLKSGKFYLRVKDKILAKEIRRV